MLEGAKHWYYLIILGQKIQYVQSLIIINIFKVAVILGNARSIYKFTSFRWIVAHL